MGRIGTATDNGETMPTIKVSLSIGFPAATRREEIEIDDDEWNGCDTDEERDALMDEYAKEWALDYIEIGAKICER